jgi:hypothetical protein
MAAEAWSRYRHTIANSMAEMSTMAAISSTSDLKKHNLNHFDAWLRRL